MPIQTYSFHRKLYLFRFPTAFCNLVITMTTMWKNEVLEIAIANGLRMLHKYEEYHLTIVRSKTSHVPYISFPVNAFTFKKHVFVNECILGWKRALRLWSSEYTENRSEFAKQAVFIKPLFGKILQHGNKIFFIYTSRWPSVKQLVDKILFGWYNLKPLILYMYGFRQGGAKRYLISENDLF